MDVELPFVQLEPVLVAKMQLSVGSTHASDGHVIRLSSQPWL